MVLLFVTRHLTEGKARLHVGSPVCSSEALCPWPIVFLYPLKKLNSTMRHYHCLLTMLSQLA